MTRDKYDCDIQYISVVLVTMKHWGNKGTEELVLVQTKRVGQVGYRRPAEIEFALSNLGLRDH